MLLKIQVVYYESRLFLINYIGVINVTIITKNKLVEEKKLIKRNSLAYAVLIQILNREKGNIELKFMRF